ncbi:MAG: zinc ABC transporter substrate-binding protein [Propionibacteriaceae bacterium]|nr:zinc ABC transporter substrate-binding protein [Propionibacteriaceae bacterium]
MKLWKALAATLAIASMTTLAACSTGAPAASGPAGGLRAVVAFYPFQFITERIGGDQVDVANLTQPGSEPHDLELTAQQVASLTTVDLVVFQSGFQAAVDTALQQAQPKRVVDAAAFLTLAPATEPDEHETEEGAAGTEPGHGGDPHTWLDPANMVTIAEHVRDSLIEAKPAARATFAANADALIADLNQLDTDYKAGLAGCAIQPFVTSHAAFGYLAARYGLEQVAIRGLEPDTEPTAARIAEVQQIARDHGVTTIFFETLVSPVVSESIANDLGLKTDVLDPLEGITPESRGTDYLEVMRSNLTSLRTANQCS